MKPKEETQKEPIIFEILISTSSTYQLGDEIRGIILFKLNGTQIDPTEKTVNIYSIEGEGFSSEIINLIPINEGMYYFNYLPDKIGTYFVNVNGNINGTNNIEISSFQVIERFITKTDLDETQNILTNIIYQAQNDIQNILTNIIYQAQNDIKDNINQELSSLQSNLIEKINAIPIIIENSSLSARNSIEELISQTTNELEVNIQSNLNSTRESLLLTIEDEHNQVTSMKNNLDSVNVGVSNASVWITVVGLIALITLVLELMMFVRKIS